MKTEDYRLSNLLKEVMDYANKNDQYSYYELKAYMVEHKPEWREVFEDKDTRLCLSTYLKSARKAKRIKVKPMFKSVQILHEAQQRTWNKARESQEEAQNDL